MCAVMNDRSMKEHSEDDYSHVLKYTSIFGGVQGLAILIGLVRNKFMAVLLGAGGMGFNALLTSIQNFSSQCTNLGITFGAVPKLSEIYEQDFGRKLDYYIQVVRLWSLIAAVLGLLFCLCLSPVFNQLSFTWGDHTLHYAMLGVAVAMTAVTGGEMAILKATRRLGQLVRIQVYVALGSAVLSIPIYYFWSDSGVVPAIVIISFFSMLATMCYSCRIYPLRFWVDRQMFRDGRSMIMLGVAFVAAAAIGSGAEMMVRSFLNVEGGLGDVGLYNAAYTITISYAGMVFSAMETDFYPRLSAVSQDVEQTNLTVNKQMEVSLLLLSPMLVVLMVMLPMLVPMLFSREFQPVADMAQVAVLAMYFKVLTLPVAYITLARRYSLTYLLLESSYFIVFVIANVIGFRYWGVYGTGIAIVVAHVFEYLFVNGFAYLRYGYRRNQKVTRSAVVQLTIGVATLVVTLRAEGYLYWCLGAAMMAISTWYSVNKLRQSVSLWNALKRKIAGRRS